MDSGVFSETRRESIRGGSLPASLRATVSEKTPQSMLLPMSST